jgi:hypothetical protein
VETGAGRGNACRGVQRRAETCSGSARKLHMRWQVTSRKAGASGEPLEAEEESRAVQNLA